ncbi:helix-turn-helix domain-containing protein [Plebeiibacterium sediminum]|uniref:AraC family transcriptional regulator n=1 Tax=Plebeiibacterium sediminum TaxID=2992112 RepID=A0AAE3M195_9BACT|nr:AraC family transcriptional regulator [Plebeiobacterium sediminum]MCW3785046.1 AraC family transcriptional regulator [Plebeiobacterium sediminum]
MTTPKQNIPTYGLQSFSHPQYAGRQFQVEVFDANRHFQVSYPHRHDFFEVLFLQKGSGFHVIDSSKYKIEPPCIFFMSPGQAHKLEFSSDIDGYLYIFAAEYYLYDKNNQNRLLEFPFFFTINQDNPPLQLTNENDAHFFKQLFIKAINEVEKDIINTDLTRSLLDTILNYASSLYKNEEQKIEKGKGHLLVKRFFQLVEENYQNNISVNQYAEMLAITPNHLTQTIKQLTGRTSNEILQSKQILEIKRLLIHTNLSVTQIADELNFNDQSYFTKFFKKVTGTTPGKFRAKHA